MSAFFGSSEKISNHIMMVHFKGNPTITIIVAYAPTEDKSVTEKKTPSTMIYQDAPATFHHTMS
jgi:hypothetical protein